MQANLLLRNIIFKYEYLAFIMNKLLFEGGFRMTHVLCPLTPREDNGRWLWDSLLYQTNNNQTTL